MVLFCDVIKQYNMIKGPGEYQDSSPQGRLSDKVLSDKKYWTLERKKQEEA